MTTPPPSSAPPSAHHRTTQRDLDCTSLARDALFPLKRLNRSQTTTRGGGRRTTITTSPQPSSFPAAEALGRVRDAAMAAEPDRAASSFFPRGVVVVHDLSSDQQHLEWNGQPDLAHGGGSIDVIPRLLSVASQHCSGGGHKEEEEAYVKTVVPRESSNAAPTLQQVAARQIVLCSNRVLQKDYSGHSSMPDVPRSLAHIEEVLAHHITKVGDLLESERRNIPNNHTTCQGRAAMEVRAARAAECYFGSGSSSEQHQRQAVRRGSSLGFPGYSLAPKWVQERLRNRCVRASAERAIEKEFGAEGLKCVAQVMEEEVNREDD